MASSDAESDDGSSVSSLQQTQRKTAGKPGSGSVSRRSSASSEVGAHKKAARSASSDSSTSSESSAASSSVVRNSGTTFTPEEQKQKFKSSPAESPAGSGAATPRSRLSSTGSDTSKKPFQSRFLANRQSAATAAVEKPTKEEEEDEEEESESSSESEETDSEDESADETSKNKPDQPAANKSVDKSDIGPLLARSALARDTSEAARKNSRDDSSTTGYGRSRYGSGADTSTINYRPSYSTKDENPVASTGSKYLNRSRGPVDEDNTTSSRYGSGSGYTSRFLNKSKSSAVMSPDEEADSGGKKYSTADDSNKYPSGRSRYAALKDRRARLARSRSSHSFGGPDDEEAEDGRTSPTSSTPTTYLASRYGSGTQSSNELARSRSTHALKSRDNSPDRSAAGTEKDGAALSSWARYLKNKYGNKSSNKDAGGSASGASSSPSASATAARRLSLGLPLRHNSASIESSDDDQKNPGGSPTSPTAAAAAAGKQIFRCSLLFLMGDRTVLKALCYKSEDRWFDPGWCHLNFSLT